MPAERARRIEVERIRDLYGAPGRPLVAAAATSFILAVQAGAWCWAFAPALMVVSWVALTLGAEAGTTALVTAYHRRPRTDDEVRAWGRIRVGAEALRGLAWSLMAWLALDPQSTISLFPIGFTLIGLVAATSGGLAVHVPSMLAFVASVLAPAAVFLMLRRDGVDELIAAGMLGTSLAMVGLNGVRMSAVYLQLIENRLDLAEQLDQRRHLQEAAEEGRRAAEAAARERTRFFGAASHDLRQPVHALGLYASLLRRDPPARERKELIAAVASCVEALERLFNAILGVSQAVDARDATRVQPTRLEDVIGRTILQFLPEAERRGLRLRVRRTSAWVLADPTPLERVLSNLLSNAIRYTQRGGVLVGARRRGKDWELVVADTGIGLEDTDQRRVFDAFFRVSRRHGEDDRAFGLGLATVRQICLTQGWEVGLTSRAGQGSVFRVRLPACAPAPAAVATATERAETPVAPGRRRVLVVEDDPLVADAVGKLLSVWDVEAHLCETSATALQILQDQPAGRWVVILDYRLAGPETGLDVADRIRERYGEAFPLALLTGELDTAVFDAARARGILVLQKPLRPIRLRALLSATGPADA